MTAKLYVNTDIDIKITIGTGFLITDIASMTVTLSKAGATSGVTFSGANVVVGASHVTLRIPDSGGITLPGVYYLKVLFNDAEGNVRGLTPTPEYLVFYA
jgi:hypothetical protein